MSQIEKSYYLYNEEGQIVIEDNTDEWFAYALCLWECKSLTENILSVIENIISSGIDIKNWQELGAEPKEVEKRKKLLKELLAQLHSEKKTAKRRIKPKVGPAPFKKGDLIAFKLENGNYGASVCLFQSEGNQEIATNVFAISRINQPDLPTKKDIMKSHIVIKNYGNWKNEPLITSKGLIYKDAKSVQEQIEIIHTMHVVGSITINKEFEPMQYVFNFDWNLDQIYALQRESEQKGEAKVNLSLSVKKVCGIGGLFNKLIKNNHT